MEKLNLNQINEALQTLPEWTYTHDSGGITEKDIAIVKALDSLIEQFGSFQNL